MKRKKTGDQAEESLGNWPGCGSDSKGEYQKSDAQGPQNLGSLGRYEEGEKLTVWSRMLQPRPVDVVSMGRPSQWEKLDITHKSDAPLWVQVGQPLPTWAVILNELCCCIWTEGMTLNQESVCIGNSDQVNENIWEWRAVWKGALKITISWLETQNAHYFLNRNYR